MIEVERDINKVFERIQTLAILHGDTSEDIYKNFITVITNVFGFKPEVTYWYNKEKGLRIYSIIEDYNDNYWFSLAHSCKGKTEKCLPYRLTLYTLYLELENIFNNNLDPKELYKNEPTRI